MISLAAFVDEHREAVSYDLLTTTGQTINDIGSGLEWSALDVLIRNAKPDGALIRELRPELSQWSTIAKTNAILADLYDLIAVINANFCAKGSGKKPKKPKPYPRPQTNDKNAKHIGTAVPVDILKKKLLKRR